MFDPKFLNMFVIVPYEAAVFALSPRVRATGEEQLGSVEDVDEDGELGLDQRPEVVLEHGDDVLQELYDYPVHPSLQVEFRRRYNFELGECCGCENPTSSSDHYWPEIHSTFWSDL